jgi:hypothetical protein
LDISLVDGMGVSLAQTVILECGADICMLPTDKHFCFWLVLAPHNDISGEKVIRASLNAKSAAKVCP